MHAVINHLEIREDADWSDLAACFDELDAMIDDPDFRGCSFVRTDDSHGIVLVLFSTRPALERISSEVAAPWFAANIRPFLSGPARRSVGQVVGGALAQ